MGISEHGIYQGNINLARDALKFIAIVAMTADHISTFFVSPDTTLYRVCQFVGNFTIVIMCYSLVMGLSYTRSIQKYALRLLIWALIAQMPFSLLNGFHLNVLFTLLASLLIVFTFDRFGNLYGSLAMIVFFPFSILCDWSIIAPAFALVFYRARKKEKLQLSLFWLPATYLILRTILYTETEAEYVLGTLSILCSAIIVFIFARHADQRKQSLIPGWFFYAYYPLH